MRRISLIGCVAILALAALSCTPEETLEVSVNEIDDGVVIKNVGSVDCLVSVSSPDGERQFKLAVGGNVTVTDISQPIELSPVSLANTS